ncbi:hypothetical protein CTP10_R25610 [Cupriavidus sp. P-10]|uniref:hypothetical protein n=1 Tax=unclassified Cupriavidus TaxID=2640874 RepID=UPI0011C0CD0E|nr:hypothetical protein [Cupriavidus sp. P-10]BDB25186.1 hypothetical protein CTP10_R25610 [Cupriavidus sp. P-10]
MSNEARADAGSSGCTHRIRVHAQDILLSYPKKEKTLLRKWENESTLGLMVVMLMSAVVLLFVMPWAPIFPGEDLERSWQLGLNYAAANGLRFGSDVIFTFGPFSAVYTRNYYPNIFFWAQSVSALLGFVLLACKWRMRPMDAAIPHIS